MYSEFGNIFFEEAVSFIGAGMGVVLFSIDKIHFSTKYQDTANPSRDLSSYNSRSDQSIFHIVPSLQLHTGLYFNTSDKIRYGIKFTISHIGSIGYNGIYSTHPMQNVDPNFSFSEGFSDAIDWRAVFVVKWMR